jgi:hypothetical protein
MFMHLGSFGFLTTFSTGLTDVLHIEHYEGGVYQHRRKQTEIGKVSPSYRGDLVSA